MLNKTTQRRTAGLLVRGLIAAALVPLLLLVQTGAAEAVSYGPTVSGTVNFEGSSWRPYSEYSCAVASHYVVTGSNETVSGKVSCSGGWNSWLATGAFTSSADGTLVLTFDGTDGVTGGACSMSASVDYDSGDATHSKSFATTLWPQACGVGQLCMSVVYTVHTPALPDDTSTNDECIDFSMGSPPGASSPAGACTLIDSLQPPAISPLDGTWSIMRMKIGAWATPTPTLNQKNNATFIPYVVFGDGSRAGFAVGSTITWPGGGYGTFQGSSLDEPSNGAYSTWQSSLTGPHGGVIGAGIMQVNVSSPGSPSPAGVTGLPSEDPNGRIGITDLTHCSWYWGQKIANVAGDTDEPIGPLPGVTPTEPTDEPTPPTQDSGCGFSLSSPSTWASAGMCEAVGLLGSIARLLGQIVSGIAGLAADIVSGILGGLGDLLQALFVPSPGFVDDTMSGMRDDWDDTSPGAYMTGLGDAIPTVPSGASCSGIPVDFTLGLGGHTTPVDFDLGAACGGDTLHAAAGIVKTILSAFLLVGAAWACVRYVVGAIYPSVLVSGREGGVS